MDLRQLAIRLERRRGQLGMGCPTLAHRTGLGLRTVQRALSGNDSVAPELETLSKIANALGVSIRLKLEGADVDGFREQQAERKAAKLVSLTQGTSALEAQAVSKGTLARMKKRAARELLCGSARKLWAD